MSIGNLPAQHVAGYALLVGYSIVIFGLALFSACEVPQAPDQSRNASNTNYNANTNNTPPPATKPETARFVPVTLPVLDAMFVDEAFTQELKQKAGLSDEQVQKLRDAARDAVLKLNDASIQDEGRSTRATTRDAEAKIREIVGAEKAPQVIALIRERWQGDSEVLTAAAPSSVPTDSRVVVNAPAYRMDIFRDGQLVKSYRVGIGYPEFPLPTGLRDADKIIFNPTWTPPDEPWVKGKVRPGKTVEAGSKLNPLGPIKIPIGLPSLIHGGKQPSRLGNFASHGCVGLTNELIQDFAVQLSSIAGSPVTLQEVKTYQKQKTETEEYKLAQPVKVELRYETIAVEDGTLKIYRDVYERSTNTEENLRRVLQSFGVDFDQLAPEIREQITEGLESMAVDATGEPVEEGQGNTSNKNTSSKVTRNVKGKKEFAIKLPELNGKGYPAPLGMTA
ncbi:MAG: L,D-transpeptidase family protein [Pyrinomonadaceae bacterium]|nr:L,D-transpeptidase family protein [Pyrinomonadaceae bacterium]